MRFVLTIFSLLCTLFAKPQVSFRTVVPRQAVVSGDAFQVQYVLSGAAPGASIRTPVFPGFRLISGPNVYAGTGNAVVQNFVFTLEAREPGKFRIPGAVIQLNNGPLQSNAVFLQVISVEEARRGMANKDASVNSDYILRPGEDPYRKIKENLFLQVQVNKRSCLVGEPLLATFKLYSRLESQSDIIKNPGFYGFTVYDVVGLSDQQVTTEKRNGQVFDVHTIRTVQLYPLQAGRFRIDPMDVKNRVEFARGGINRKTEQSIAEGMLGTEPDEPAAVGTEVYETTMSTLPVDVEVRPLPEQQKPPVYSGAVGHFRVEAKLANTRLAKNEQGFLELIISGKGNFTQLDPPLIQWPAGVEGFDPIITDELDKSTTPLNGRRRFRFPFVCAAPGRYRIPAVSFAFFDPDSNRYKTIQSLAVEVEAGQEIKKDPVAQEHKTSLAEQNEKAARTAGLIAIAAVLLVLLYWITKRKEKTPVPVDGTERPQMTNVEDLLQPARESMLTQDRSFYTNLQTAVWQFAAQRFGLSGSAMNKKELLTVMNRQMGNATLGEQLIRVLETCEAGMFTQALTGADWQLLLEQTRELLEQTDARLL